MSPDRRTHQSLVHLVASVVLIGCASGGGTDTVTPPPPPAPAAVASVSISPSSASVVLGGSGPLVATPHDASGNTLTGRTITWSSSNPAIASVSSSGVVTGVAVGGPVTITATSEGITGAATITVQSVVAGAVAQVTIALDSARTGFLRFAAQTGGNPAQALALTATAIRSQPGIASATLIDSTYLLVQTSAGIQTEFSYDQRGTDGLSLSRGGRAVTRPVRLASFGRAARAISNKNVLICAPNFSHQYPAGAFAQILDTIAASGVGATVSVLTDNNCGYFTVSQFAN